MPFLARTLKSLSHGSKLQRTWILHLRWTRLENLLRFEVFEDLKNNNKNVTPLSFTFKSRNKCGAKLINTFLFRNFTAIKQTLISISSEPDSSKSLWITTQLTLPSCLESVCMGNIVSRFQIWEVKKKINLRADKFDWKKLLPVCRAWGCV